MCGAAICQNRICLPLNGNHMLTQSACKTQQGPPLQVQYWRDCAEQAFRQIEELKQHLQGLAAATAGDSQAEPLGTPRQACGLLHKLSLSTRWLLKTPGCQLHCAPVPEVSLRSCC